MLENLHLSWPLVLSIGGALLIAWGQKDFIKNLLSKFRPAQRTTGDLTPAERFERFYELRAWCELVGNAEAVKVLDGAVLQAIVQGGPNK
jgi:hypothetical protein